MMSLTRSYFALRDLPGKKWSGYVDPRASANGWCIPYFDAQTCLDICETLGLSIDFDTSGRLVVFEKSDPYAYSAYPNISINGVFYWALGGYEWYWSEVKNEDCDEC